MDFRYTVPPLLNFILFWWLGSWNWELVASSISVRQFAVLELVVIIFTMMLLLFFLFTSVEIPLNLNPIHPSARHFSIALTMSLMASVFLPPSLFWAVYLLIVFLSPWHDMFFELLKHFFRLLNEESPTPDDLEPGVRAIREGNLADQQN